MARTSSLVAGFVAGVVVAASTTAIAVTGTADTSTDLNSKATTTWLTVKVADAMGTRDTITWVPTGSFAGSAEERVPRYPMTPIQGKDTKDLKLSAVRNEQVSAQLAIASGHNLDDVKAVVGDLTGPGGAKLSGADTQVRFVKYVPVQRSKSEVDWSATIDQVSSGKEVSGDRNPDVVGDPLAEGSSVDVPAYAAQPLWFTFHIPKGAKPGTYTGTVKVNADGRTQSTYPLTIEVADASVPDPKDYSFFLDVWAQPETIAKNHGVKLWSDEHWKLIDKYDRDLASRGQKVINTTIVDNPWHHQWSLGTRESQTATPYTSMVGWAWNGKTFSFDFSRWDKYVETARRAGLGPDIGAFSMLAFQDQEHLTYTDTTTGKSVYENVDLGGDRWRQAWGAFLPAFEQHVKAKGWLDHTWLSFDERPIDTMTVVKNFVHEVAPAFDNRISVAGSINTEGVASNLSVDWGGIDAMTKEKVEERRKAGKITTFYVRLAGPPEHAVLLARRRVADAALDLRPAGSGRVPALVVQQLDQRSLQAAGAHLHAGRRVPGLPGQGRPDVQHPLGAAEGGHRGLRTHRPAAEEGRRHRQRRPDRGPHHRDPEPRRPDEGRQRHRDRAGGSREGADVMRGRWRSLLLAGALTAMSLSGAGVVTPAQAEQQTPARHTVTYDQHSVLVDGKPLYIWGAEFHYFRLPSPDAWRDVLQKIKAGGFNAVSLYFDWGYHSSKPGSYDFTGTRDVERLLDEAERAGLYVIARPGPYINAEVSGGGMPAWRSTQAGVNRTSEPEYLKAAREWMSRINPIIARHQLTRGTGSVILYQIENEYQGGRHDADYMQTLIDWAKEDGIDVPTFVNDGGANQNWVSGKGAPDIYGFDAYPQGFDCKDPDIWKNLPDYSYVNEWKPESPLIIPEAQGGAFDPGAAPDTRTARSSPAPTSPGCSAR